MMFVFFFMVTLLLHTTQPQAAVYQHHRCPNTTVFSLNSTFQTNLNSLFTTLSSNAALPSGFHNATAGSTNTTDTAYGLFLCRGDVNTSECNACVPTAIAEAVRQCPIEKNVEIWLDLCMVRYSNVSFFGIAANRAILVWNNAKIGFQVDRFNQLLSESMMDVAAEAANRDNKFATRQVNFTGRISLYSLGQCTQDLSSFKCNRCLNIAIQQLPVCCDGKVGGRVLYPSCYVRFEVYPFYESVMALPPEPAPAPVARSLPPPPPPSLPSSTKRESQIVVIIVVSVAASLLILFLAFCICSRFRKTKKKLQRKRTLLSGEDDDEIPSSESLQFDFDTIRNATDNFSEANKLGEGGFGSVYKGQLTHGKLVAVKRLSLNSGQGDLEFKNEVLLLAKLQHRNLVRLLGFCSDGNEKVLVYEYVPNTSLDHIIFDPIKRAQLDWNSRYKIIVGIVRGLLYLHEDSRLRIIHRDLKVSNILLDDKHNPKIADFGMAKLFMDDQTQGNASRIVGTYGYMAPEYLRHGQFSVKSDVYSFGVLVLEIVAGQKNSCFCHGENSEDLLSYAWTCWEEGTTTNLIDPTLKNGSRSEMMRCIQIGLLCVQENIVDRPTMTSISIMLNSYSLALPLPSLPSSFMTRRTYPMAVEYIPTIFNEDWTELYPQFKEQLIKFANGFFSKPYKGL